MGLGLLVDADQVVADWIFESQVSGVFKYDKALGIVDPAGKLVGAIMFTNWNGPNVELSYYGKNLLTLGIVRVLARYVNHVFDPARLTVITSKKNRDFIKSLRRFGFRLEGAQRCFYGKKDCVRNTGIRFVLFREQIDHIANPPYLRKAA